VGKVEKIWIKRFKRGPMDAVTSAELLENEGVKNSADQKGKRQITLIELEKWEWMTSQLKCDLDPSARRANMMISGISLTESRGKILNIGKCRIKVHGETRPCERMDEAQQGLREVMKQNWNGGVYGVIVEGGTIKIGDTVNFI